MDSGAEDRSRLRLHVRAAREWLGRAEESLGRADDVRGDLNLMLAQAELTRAKETECPGTSVVWVRRLAPLFVAALIAGGGYFMWRTGIQAGPEPPVQRAMQSATALPEAVTLSPTARQETKKAMLPEITEAPAREEEPPEIVPMAEPELPETVETMQESVQQARLPSEDMQRLMNSAGQSLRSVQ